MELPRGAALKINAIPCATAVVVGIALYRNGYPIAVAMHKPNMGNAAHAGVVNAENIAR